ncbi:MAG: PAS domain-containing sensor histidine kinase [Candidatus Eremiobacteraeota bacterium]|nr:PAS domain-containing sensor histidine kinase [Candidatus Eremiobacteraeota bacterium]
MTEPEEILLALGGEETFRGLLESAPDAMVIVDAKGRITLVNAQTERLFGFDRRDLIGKPIEMLIPERFRGGHVAHRDNYAHDPHIRPMGAGLELFGRRKDGSEFPVGIMLSPINTMTGKLVVSAIRDITDVKLVEQALQSKNEALEEANLAKDRFLAGMSHELRTPLNAIIGFTGTLLMKLPGPLTAEQEEQLRVVQSSARHLLSLINDVLDLAKVQSGTVEVHFEPVDVAQLLAELSAGLRQTAQQKGLHFRLSLPQQQLTITTDKRALQQILTNLIGNAIKYTPAGLLHVTAAQAPRDGRRYVAFTVEDSGVGISPEDQRRIFEPFEQVDTSSTRRFEGVGLGLFLSNRLAKILGGELSVVSAPGEGSTFTLMLPID